MEREKMHDEIRRLAGEKRAVILAHNYQRYEVQQVADLVGDSLGLSAKAAATDARMIVFAGVHFMAESAKILSPGKKVVMPRADAGCPLANTITVEALRALQAEHPGAPTVCYSTRPPRSRPRSTSAAPRRTCCRSSSPSRIKKCSSSPTATWAAICRRGFRAKS